MWKLSDRLLRDRAKQTNLRYSYSDYVTGGEYPEQLHELIGSTVHLSYVTEYKCNIKTRLEAPSVRIVDGEEISLRPEDDYQFLKKVELNGSDFDDAKDIFDDDFMVLRADATEPYVFIGISLNYENVVISSTEINEMSHYRFLDDVTIYPLQFNEFFDIPVRTHYMNDKFVDDVEYDAKILRIDKTEPNRAVLVEFVDEENIRFVLGDEVNVVDNETFDSENYISDNMIAEYRRELLGGRIIYGSL